MAGLKKGEKEPHVFSNFELTAEQRSRSSQSSKHVIEYKNGLKVMLFQKFKYIIITVVDI